MMKLPSYILAVTFVLANSASYAQAIIPADIGVTLTATPNTGLTTGEPIAVTNYGPAPAPRVWSRRRRTPLAAKVHCYVLTIGVVRQHRPELSVSSQRMVYVLSESALAGKLPEACLHDRLKWVESGQES